MDEQEIKGGLFGEEWAKIGCPICQSPFHVEAECPQTKQGEEPKFKFRSRKEMGLEPGSLPFKFRVEIDPDADDEVEITRKKAIMRLNASKVYNLMGISVKAHESQKQALQWLIRLSDELDIDDPAIQRERNSLLPLIQKLQEALSIMTKIRELKISQAAALEEMVTKERDKARRARLRMAKKKQQQDKEFWVLRLPDSGVDIPIVEGEERTPTELFKDVADAIMKQERLKLGDDEEPNE